MRNLAEQTDPFAAAMSEADLQESVRQLCRVLRLPYFHVHDSRRSPEGWPDCAIVRGDELLLRELKTLRGKPTPAQIQWLDALSRVTRVSAGVWRSSDWTSGLIEGVLTGRKLGDQ